MRPIFLLSLILLVTASLVPLRSPARAQTVSAPAAAIEFLPGVCGYPPTAQCRGAIDPAARARATFGVLIAALRRASVAYVPSYYSYVPSGGRYTAADTHQSLARSVQALATQVAALGRKYPALPIVLVGHSLGGVVAAEWIAEGGTAGYNVRSVVTLDSPLNGIQSSVVGDLLARVFGGQVWSDLAGTSAAIKRITAHGETWWRARHLHTVANRADLIVPPVESVLASHRIVDDSHCAVDLLVFRSCHGAVLADVSLNNWIACHWITTSRQCAPAAVTPTATATPSTPSAVTPGPGQPPSPPAQLARAP